MTPPSPTPLLRLRLSTFACFDAWLAATLLTVPFELTELWRNAPRASALPLLLLQGSALWLAFTLAVCLVLWLLLVLPAALAIPPEPLLRARPWLLAGAPLAALLLIGWRLGTWNSLIHQQGPDSPLASLLFWNYSLYGMTFAAFTAWRYTASLATAIRAAYPPNVP